MKNKTIKEFRNTSNSDLQYYNDFLKDLEYNDLEDYKKSAEDIDSKDIDFNIPETRLKQLFNNALSTLKIELKDFIPNIDINKEINYEKFLKLVYIMCIEDPELKETLQIKINSYEVKVINDNFYKNLNIKNNFKYLFETSTTNAESGFSFIFNQPSYNDFKESIFNYFKRKLSKTEEYNNINTNIQQFFNEIFRGSLFLSQRDFSTYFGNFFEEIINACIYKIINENDNFNAINFDNNFTKLTIIVLLLLNNNFDNSNIVEKYTTGKKPDKNDYFNVFKHNKYFLTEKQISYITNHLVQYFTECKEIIGIKNISCLPYSQDIEAYPDTHSPRFDFIFRNKDELINEDCLYKIGLFDIKSSNMKGEKYNNGLVTGSNRDDSCIEFINNIVEVKHEEKTKFHIYFLGLFKIEYIFFESPTNGEIIDIRNVYKIISGVKNALIRSVGKRLFFIDNTGQIEGNELKSKFDYVKRQRNNVIEVDQIDLYRNYLFNIVNLETDEYNEIIPKAEKKPNSTYWDITNNDKIKEYINNLSFYIITKKVIDLIDVQSNKKYIEIFEKFDEYQKQKIKKIINNNNNRPDNLIFNLYIEPEKPFYAYGATYNALSHFHVENDNNEDREKVIYTIRKILDSIINKFKEIYDAINNNNISDQQTTFDELVSFFNSKPSNAKFCPEFIELRNQGEFVKLNKREEISIKKLNILETKAYIIEETYKKIINVKEYKTFLDAYFVRNYPGYGTDIRDIKTWLNKRYDTYNFYFKTCINIKLFFNWLNSKNINKEKFEQNLIEKFNKFEENFKNSRPSDILTSLIHSSSSIELIFKNFFRSVLHDIDASYKSLEFYIGADQKTDLEKILFNFIIRTGIKNSIEIAKQDYSDFIRSELYQEEEESEEKMQTDSIIRNNLMSLVEVYSFLYKMY